MNNKIVILNSIRDFYTYGPARAKDLQKYLEDYYADKIPLKDLFNKTLEVCDVIMKDKDDKYFLFTWNLSKAILAYQLKGGDK